MQIMIDIPDDIYSAIVKQYRTDKELQTRDNLYKAIVNGTPLPKGHGDLVDRSEVIKSLFDYHKGKKTIGQCIDDVQTILEADAESDGDDSEDIPMEYFESGGC